jgi:hypothetical protein
MKRPLGDEGMMADEGMTSFGQPNGVSHDEGPSNGNGHHHELELAEQHRDFLLAALRAASVRAKLMECDINTIGLALKAGMIGPDTAVQWIRDSGLTWLVGALPEAVGRLGREDHDG